MSNDGRMRLELQSDNGDAQVVVSNGRFWIYDPSANTRMRQAARPPHGQAVLGQRQDPDDRAIQQQVNELIQHANLSGAIPSDVAGQAAYTVRVSPKHDGGLLGPPSSPGTLRAACR